MASADGYGGVRARMAEVTRENAELVVRLNHMHDILEFTSDVEMKNVRKAEWMRERDRSVSRLNQVQTLPVTSRLCKHLKAAPQP